jgi:hypothetical protein
LVGWRRSWTTPPRSSTTLPAPPGLLRRRCRERSGTSRAFRNPDGFSAESDGDYSYQRTGVEPGIYLTPGEEKAIRRALGRGGLWTQPTERGDMCLHDTVWVNDQYGCDPIPYDVYHSDL